MAGYGYNKIQIMRRNGTVECWVESKDKTCDAWMLPDRNIIYSCGKNDPLEQNNLAYDPEHADKVTEMLQKLAEAQTEAGDTCPLTVADPEEKAWTPPE